MLGALKRQEDSIFKPHDHCIGPSRKVIGGKELQETGRAR